MKNPFLLETPRLLIRALEVEDFAVYVQLLAANPEVSNNAPVQALFDWYRIGATVQSMLYQPPYGDRGIILKSTNTFVGVAGFVPLLDSFSLIAELEIPGPSDVKTAEVGLFYAVHPDHRSMGYATEATHALIEYGWSVLNLRRVVATTSYDNHPSIRVMEKCGMRICRNPFPDPEWLQIVAYVNHPDTDQNSQRIQ